MRKCAIGSSLNLEFLCFEGGNGGASSSNENPKAKQTPRDPRDFPEGLRTRFKNGSWFATFCLVQVVSLGLV